jgi:hypothetical protein
MRGRIEDTINRYQSLSPKGQEAFRSGYVDPLIAQTQGAAFGVSKARPLLNDAFAAEADAMADQWGDLAEIATSGAVSEYGPFCAPLGRS